MIMSMFEKMSKIDLGPSNAQGRRASTQASKVLACSPIYMALYWGLALGVAICVLAQLAHPSAILANLASFWIPLIFFFAAMDFSGWFLFQSRELKLILPLPFEDDEIHKRFRGGESSSLIFYVLKFALSIAIGAAVGIGAGSFWSGLTAGVFAFVVLDVLDRMALILVVKFHRSYLPYRRWVFFAAVVPFPILAAVFAADESSARSAVDLLSAAFAYNLFPLRAHSLWFISSACALTIFDGYLFQWEMDYWKRSITRFDLLKTAFPLATAKPAKKSTTFLEFAAKLDAARPRKLRNSLGVDAGDAEKQAERTFLTRIALVLSDVSGLFSAWRFFGAVVGAAFIPPIARLAFTSNSYPYPLLDTLAIPFSSIILFFVILAFRGRSQNVSERIFPISYIEDKAIIGFFVFLIPFLSGAFNFLVANLASRVGWMDIASGALIGLTDVAISAILAATIFIGIAPAALFECDGNGKWGEYLLVSAYQLLLLSMFPFMLMGLLMAKTSSVGGTEYHSIYGCGAVLATGLFKSFLVWLDNGIPSTVIGETLKTPPSLNQALAAYAFVLLLFILALYSLFKHGKGRAKRVFLRR